MDAAMHRRIWGGVSLGLVVLGIAFWVVMGITQDAWMDVGVYSFSIVLIGFGVFGLLAVRAHAVQSRSDEPPFF